MRALEQQSRLILWSSMAVLAVAIVWASLAEVDQITRAQGKVIASSRSQIIQSSEGGVLEKLLVREGSTVKKGELLAVFDKTRLEASFQESRAKEIALSAQVARLKAEVYDEPLDFPVALQGFPALASAQRALYTKRRSALAQDIAALERSADLVREELALNTPLLQRGDVSEVDVIRLRRQVSDIEAQISTRRNKHFQDAQAELVKAEEDLNSITQNVAQRRDALSRTELVAPVAGVVKNIRVTTLGGVLKASEEVMQIVPSGDDLLLELKVRPQDIAFLKLGLPANVKIDAYDYTIYGIMNGTLSYLSPDTLEEGNKPNEQAYYRALVTSNGKRFSGRPGENLEIQPGMTATVDIITGRSTVLKFLTKPLVKTVTGSMSER